MWLYGTAESVNKCSITCGRFEPSTAPVTAKLPYALQAEVYDMRLTVKATSQFVGVHVANEFQNPSRIDTLKKLNRTVIASW